MEALRHHYIEHEILRQVFNSQGDPSGLPVSLPEFCSIFREWYEDFKDTELVDAFKRLSPRFLTLHKWSNEHSRFMEYPSEISDDGEFFYRADFRARRTPFTDPRRQELAMMFPTPEEPERAKRPIGFQP